MTDTPPLSGATDFAAASVNLRETAKWLVGGVVAASVGVLVGSPLTKLGTLGPGLRLYAALAGAALTLILLGVLLQVGLGVIAGESISIETLAAARGRERARVRRVQRAFEGRWPGGATDVADLIAKSEALFAAARGKPETSREALALTAFQDELHRLMPEVVFEYKRDRLGGLRAALFFLAPIIVLCVAVYAWAANPRDEPKPLSETPQLISIPLAAAEAPRLSPALGPSCYAPAEPGSVTLKAVVIAEYPGGRSELVTLPTKTCPPVHLTEQNGHVFAK